MGYSKKKHNKNKIIILSVVSFLLITLGFMLYKIYFTNMIFSEIDKKKLKSNEIIKLGSISNAKIGTEIIAPDTLLTYDSSDIFYNKLIKIDMNSLHEINSLPDNKFLKQVKTVLITPSNLTDNLLIKAIESEQFSENKKSLLIDDNRTISINIENKELTTKNGKYKEFMIDFFVLQSETNSLKLTLKWKKYKAENAESIEFLIPKVKNETEKTKWYYFCVNLGKLDKKNALFNSKMSIADNKERLFYNLELKTEALLASNKTDIVNSIYITPPKIYTIEKNAWYNKKKKNIIFFDISNLTTEHIENDSLLLPTIFKLSRNSNYFTDCSENSDDKNLAISSYLSGFYPSELYHKDSNVEKKSRNILDFMLEKEKVSKALRNTTISNLYKQAGYETHHFSNIEEIKNSFDLIQDLGFDNITTVTSKKDTDSYNDEEIEHFFTEENELIFNLLESKLDLSKNRKEQFFHIILETKNLNNLISIDNHIRNFLSKFDYMNNTIVLTSSYNYTNKKTNNSFTRKNRPAIIYNKKGIKKAKNNYKVNLFDIVKTLLAYSSLNYPYHYPGKNLLKVGKEYKGREFILKENNKFSRSIENDEFHYSFYSKNGFYEENLCNKEDDDIFYSSKFNNKKYKKVLGQFRNKLQDQSAADFLKRLTVFNNTEVEREYIIEIISKQKFIEFDDLENYYKLKKNRRKNRYVNKISFFLGPNEEKEVDLFFRKRDQRFLFKFKDEMNIGYGENWIFAGLKKKFEEKSQFGFLKKTSKNPLKLSSNTDVHIMNYEIKEGILW